MMTGGVVFWGLNFEGVISGALLYIRDDFDSVDKETVLQVLTTNHRLHFFFFFLFDLTTPISSLTFPSLWIHTNPFFWWIRYV